MLEVGRGAAEPGRKKRVKARKVAEVVTRVKEAPEMNARSDPLRKGIWSWSADLLRGKGVVSPSMSSASPFVPGRGGTFVLKSVCGREKLRILPLLERAETCCTYQSDESYRPVDDIPQRYAARGLRVMPLVLILLFCIRSRS